MNKKTIEQAIDQLGDELKSVTLGELLARLKQQGITQKRIALLFGMQPNFLTVVKRCERKGHYYKFLGACKIACLYLLDITNKHKLRSE